MKPGDYVRFLNDIGGGRISRIEGKMVYVVDDDGFERPTPATQVVVVDTKKSYEHPLDIKTKLVEPDTPAPKPEPEKPAPVFETPEGEQLTVVLAYEPREPKHINTTTFFPVLVNDSNYFLYYTYMTRADDTQWTTRAHGLLEPNMQTDLEEFGQTLLNQMTHIAVALLPFKRDRHFKLKNPVMIERRLDVTKFFKFHCFQPNEYFDTPVLAIDLVRKDRPARPLTIDSSEIEQALRGERAQRDQQRRKQRNSDTKPQQQRRHEIIVQDLHIAELLDDLTGLTHADILNYQLDKFNEVMRANLNHLGQRIVFIHGKGEGVLRRAILEELKRHYPACEVQDASFKEYGFGATQVTIHRKQ